MNNDNLLHTVSYDQNIDIPTLGRQAKVIFSEEAFNFLLKLITKSEEKNIEQWCYLVGRKSSNVREFVFYFDYHTSEFRPENAIYENGAVQETAQNRYEIRKKLAEYQQASEEFLWMHFHVHNKNGYYQLYADQDYAVYTGMLNNEHIPRFSVFGMLGYPMGKGVFGLSVVLALDLKKIGNRNCADFYSIPEIYYCQNNSIHKMGTFTKPYISRELNLDAYRPDRLVQNYHQSPGTNLIPLFNVNPQQRLARDTIVGYIDSNQTCYFSNEKKQYTFSSISSINEKEGQHK